MTPQRRLSDFTHRFCRTLELADMARNTDDPDEVDAILWQFGLLESEFEAVEIESGLVDDNCIQANFASVKRGSRHGLH